MLFATLLQVLDPEPHAAALNMAIDEALLRGAEQPLLRIYRWAQPAISVGYFEKVTALPALQQGWEMVRRWTGGGVVEHGADVTYSLLVPATDAFAKLNAADSYRRIHECIARLLAEQGTAAQLAAFNAPKTSSGCFENAAQSDVLAHGRKVAGAAQRRTRWGLLHQGSVQGAPLTTDFTERLPHAFSPQTSCRVLSSAELAIARAIAAEKYATAAWQRRF